MGNVARSPRKISLMLVAMAGAAGLTVAGLPSDGASAYPHDPNACNATSLSWSFVGSGWTDAKRTAVRAGINGLTTALDADGSHLISVPELSSGGNVSVSLKDVTTQDGYGESECVGNRSLWINSNSTSTTFFKQVARHEMMHLLGAEHSGAKDSMSGDNPPAMTTCVGSASFSASESLSQDDTAYLNWLHGTEAAYHALHANVGFEQGIRFWGVSGGQASTLSSGGSAGPKNVKLAPVTTSSNPYLFQTVRLWTGPKGSATVRASVRVKGPGSTSSYSTKATVSLYRKRVTDGGTSNGCVYPRGLQDLNNPTVVDSSWTLVSTKTVSGIGASWTKITSPWVTLGVYDGYDLQVRAYASTDYTGSGTAPSNSVYLDDVYGEAQ
jgi:hypothetical protein